MHSLLHLALEVVFLIVIAVLFTIFVVVRPGSHRSPSKRTLAGLLVVGAVVGVIFISTASLYAVSQ